MHSLHRVSSGIRCFFKAIGRLDKSFDMPASQIQIANRAAFLPVRGILGVMATSDTQQHKETGGPKPP
jgi:hypothetical protein